MAGMKLIKPNQLYAGLPQGLWLKNYWEHVFPLILTREEGKLPPPGEGQSGPVMYAVGKYARAFAKEQPLVKLENGLEIYQTTNTIQRGFVLPFVKFIALESDGDGSSFAELRNVAQSLALDSDVEIEFNVTGGKDFKLMEGNERIENKQYIDIHGAKEYYCESFPIDLPVPLPGQPGYNTRSPTNRAISSSFMAIFEPQEEGTYRIDVAANYIFRFRGRSKEYSDLYDSYVIDVGPSIYRRTKSIKKGIQKK